METIYHMIVSVSTKNSPANKNLPCQQKNKLSFFAKKAFRRYNVWQAG
jgi:hypothetical protein